MNNRLIIKEAHKIFEFLRYLFSDDRNTLRSIDKTYELTLYETLELIPRDIDETLDNLKNIFGLLLRHVDVEGLLNDLTDDKVGIRFASDVNMPLSAELKNIGTLRYVIKMIKTSTMISRKEKPVILNIINKCGPLFSCIDHIIEEPEHFVTKIKLYKSDMDYNLNL